MGYFYEKDEYKEAKNMLKDEYAIAYHKAAAYIHASNYYGTEHEESCMLQILDDFLTAQNDGKPLYKITGPNLRKFCERIMKAEIERMSCGPIYWLSLVLAMILMLSAFMYLNNFVFTDAKVKAEAFKQVIFEGNMLLYVGILLLCYVIKKLISILFFNYARITNVLGALIYFLSIFFITMINDTSKNIIPISLQIPFPVYLVITALAVISFILCSIYIHKHKITYKMPPDEASLDEIDKRICPDCGKAHDYDYPACPYCRHRYPM